MLHFGGFFLSALVFKKRGWITLRGPWPHRIDAGFRPETPTVPFSPQMLLDLLNCSGTLCLLLIS